MNMRMFNYGKTLYFILFFLTLQFCFNAHGSLINYTNNTQIKILLNSSNIFEYLSINTNLSQEVQVLLVRLAGFKNINDYNKYISKKKLKAIKISNPSRIHLAKADFLYEILSERISRLEWLMERAKLNGGILDIEYREEAARLLTLFQTLRDLDSSYWFRFLTLASDNSITMISSKR